MCAFLTGLSLGAGLALLFAPRSGKKTRTQIAEAAAEGVAYAKDFGETVRETAMNAMRRGTEDFAETAAYQKAVR